MPVRTVELVLTPGEAANENLWPARLAKKLRVAPEHLKGHRLLKRSLDARKAPVKYRLRFEVGVDEELEPSPEIAWSAPSPKPDTKKIVIVGCGAQGLNQGLNMRDSGLDISYTLRQGAIDQK